MEVEEPLIDHPWIHLVVCFSVPSRIYGEEVECAIVLSDAAPKEEDERTVAKELKEFLCIRGLPPLKWPTKWILVDEADLPKTKSKKFIRVGKSHCNISWCELYEVFHFRLICDATFISLFESQIISHYRLG